MKKFKFQLETLLKVTRRRKDDAELKFAEASRYLEACRAKLQELIRELQQVIDSNLTEQDRRVLQLHYDEEMTYQETATVLGISTAAVNKHITRSLAKIRETLKIAK